MNNLKKISALLITYNEINHIHSVIENISFADEVIVIDSFSEDGTLEALETYPHVKVVKRKFKDFADQRNFAITQASFEWILFIDADERLTPELKNEIIETVNSHTSIAGFKTKRKNFFNGKAVNFSGFQTDAPFRLFKNGHVSYDKNRIVHEMPIVDGEKSILKNRMLHYSLSSAKDCKTKTILYAKLKALELYNKGKKATLFHFIFRPLYKFITNYIIRFGFLDGKTGFTLCYYGAYGVYYRYSELKRLTKMSPK